MEAELG